MKVEDKIEQGEAKDKVTIDKSTNTITNNISVKANPITTVTGILLLLVALGITVLLVLVKLGLVKTVSEPASFSMWIPGVIAIVGFSLLFFQDKFIKAVSDAIIKLISKKSDQV